MKKIYAIIFATTLLIASGVYIFNFQDTSELAVHQNHGDEDEDDGEEYGEGMKETIVKEMGEYWNHILQDPQTGEVPMERLFDVYSAIDNYKQNSPENVSAKWQSRGPKAVGGRTRVVHVDLNDPSGNTIWIGGVSGGLWKTTKINESTPEWEVINDYFDNLSVVTIAQDRNNPQLMFFGTGELHTSIRGMGIWRSKDGGATWDYLNSSTGPNFWYVNKMAVHDNGDVYAATNSGLYRSKDEGDNWERVVVISRVNDIEITSAGDIYIATGLNSGARMRKSSAGPNVGDAGTFQLVGNGFPTGKNRIEIASCWSNPDYVYAITTQGSMADAIYRTSNGGQTWTKTSNTPPGMDRIDGAQGWYDLMIDVAPDNPNIIIAGAVTVSRSVDGGSSWFEIPTSGGIHVDHHDVVFDVDRPGTVYFGNDGGIYRSTNNGTSISDKNDGYIVTQFYGAAMHPGKYSNYFLAGSQDNGTQRFTEFGISPTTNVIGGDGFLCHIDQNDPNYQFGNWQFGNWQLSVDGGNTWGLGFAANSGFISPSDYDSDTKMLYAQTTNSGAYVRWDVLANTQDVVNISGFQGIVRFVYVSPNVANRIYIGMDGGTILKINNAHTGTTVSATNIAVPAFGTVSSIYAEEDNEDHLVASISNYGTTNVFESFNNGASWSAIEGNLPDMPVHSVLFHPNDADKMLIGTEAGVWFTDDINGNSTNWQPMTGGAPFTRVTELHTRSSDNLILACTYGRGLFTTDFLSPAALNVNLEKVGYIEGSLELINQSINSQKWLWDFGNGITSSEELPTPAYTTEGTYNVNVTMNDTLSLAQSVKILPNKGTPYLPEDGGDFESNDGDFGAYSVSGSEFTKGKSTVPGKDGTKSGNNAYVLGMNDAFYQNETEARLYTPSYDLSEPGIYEFSFWSKYALQWGWDGFRVEYTLDQGASWNVLQEEQASNWYNYTNSQNETAYPVGSSYITGTVTEFVQFRTGLNDLVGNANVAFRFVFKSNAQGTSTGLAIDDVMVRKFTDVLETRVIEFQGEFKDEDRVSLSWTTLPEFNCKGFKVQFSENGKFETEGEDYTEYAILIDGQGSAIDPVTYSFEPGGHSRDLYYFRIKVLDFDDEFFYTDKIILRRGGFVGDNLDVTLVFPNPFVNYLDISFNQRVDQTLNIDMYDSAGRLVLSEAVNPKDSYYRLATEKLGGGVYVLQVRTEDVVITRKLMKMN